MDCTIHPLLIAYAIMSLVYCSCLYIYLLKVSRVLSSVLQVFLFTLHNSDFFFKTGENKVVPYKLSMFFTQFRSFTYIFRLSVYSWEKKKTWKFW
jgi:hypothetical protein